MEERPTPRSTVVPTAPGKRKDGFVSAPFEARLKGITSPLGRVRRRFGQGETKLGERSALSLAERVGNDAIGSSPSLEGSSARDRSRARSALPRTPARGPTRARARAAFPVGLAQRMQ
jgi:hypothetical protein